MTDVSALLGRLPARIRAKIEPQSDGCWMWTGAIRGTSGYGAVQRGRRGDGVAPAHRHVYMLLVGDPGDLNLDHLCHGWSIQAGACEGGDTCRHRRCVNPEHLEPVAQRQNILRGLSPEMMRARWAAPRNCPAGHPMTDENTYIHITRKGYPNRMCRICRADSSRRRRQRIQESGQAA